MPSKINHSDLRNLIKALDSSDADQVRVIIESGYANSSDKEFGLDHPFDLPLICAARSPNPDFIGWLVIAGEDPNARDSLGRTPLHVASVAGNVANCISLARYGSDSKATDGQGRTPRAAALEKGQSECVSVLDSLWATQQIESMLRGLNSNTKNLNYIS